jgi:hypothetical protein
MQHAAGIALGGASRMPVAGDSARTARDAVPVPVASSAELASQLARPAAAAASSSQPATLNVVFIVSRSPLERAVRPLWTASVWRDFRRSSLEQVYWRRAASAERTDTVHVLISRCTPVTEKRETPRMLRSSRMKTIVAFALGVLVGAPAFAVAETALVKQRITLAWNRLPSPDEAGSTRQQTALLGNQKLTYTKSDGTEKYEINVPGGVDCNVIVPKSTPFTMMMVADPGAYLLDRSSGRTAEVVWYQNPDFTPPPPAPEQSKGPNG